MEKRTRWVAAGIVLGFVAVTVTVAGVSQIGGASPTTACTIQKADSPVAFCETFDAPAGNPATRSGDLDPTIWGVSRTGGETNAGQGGSNNWAAAQLDRCGTTVTVRPPRDVQICNGKVVEAVQDNGRQTTLAMYPKQPFDIAGRTGTVAFDVGADSEGIHAAWPEFWWTDLPVPAPHGHLSEQSPYATNSFGFSLAGQCPGNVNYQDGGPDPYVGVDQMMVTRASKFSFLTYTKVGCVRKGSVTSLNHFEVRINVGRAEVWASDAGSTVLRMIAFANTTMPLTRGVVWQEDVHYNGCKFNNQCNHTFAWDNVAFDGPTPYRDLTFDVQDRTPTQLGYPTPFTVTAPGVTWSQTPTKQFVGFNWYAFSANVPDVRVNGGPWHVTAWPFDSETYVWRTIGVPIDFSEVHAGSNTIEFRSASGTVVSNINIILIAAAPVTGGPPPTTTTAPTTTTTTVPPTTTSTTSTTIPSTTTTTIPGTTTTTQPTTTTTTVPAPVHYPDGYTGEIWVGGQKIWPPDTPPTTTTIPATTTTAAPTTTTTAPTTTTTAASTTTVPATTTSTVAPPARFGMLPVGATLPSDATCAARVRAAPEQRADNVTANHTFSNGTGTKPNPRYNRVTGNFQGTTDEILQWGACKWGIDEDYVRAQAIVESYWHQNALGDNGESYGLLQVRRPYWGWAFPGAEFSSAYNVDSALAARRACFEGDDTWLNTVDRGQDYAAGDIAGCMGMWFSGRWHTAAANQYITAWQNALSQHVWTTAGFVNG